MEPLSDSSSSNIGSPRKGLSRPRSFDAVAESIGVRLERWPRDEIRLAAAVQAARRDEPAVADREGVTRSVLMYAICDVHPGVRGILQDAGMNWPGFAVRLKLDSRQPHNLDDSEILIEPELEGALRSLESGTEVTVLDLTIALLNSAASEPNGLFARRLRDLGLRRLEPALQAVADIRERLQDTDLAQVVERDFSRSVRSVRSELGPSTLVTAATIVERLRPGHGVYGKNRFASIALDLKLGRQRIVDEWLLEVRRSYDLLDVVLSAHRVIDGRLLILGLSNIDGTLTEQLSQDGFLDDLHIEASVWPIPNRNDHAPWSADTPATEDLLGRAGIAEALVKRITGISVPFGVGQSESFFVHIDSPWGGGKSTFFNLIKKEFEKQDRAETGLPDETQRHVANPRPLTLARIKTLLTRRPHSENQNPMHSSSHYLIVEVNAWREQRVGLPWWTLHNALRIAVLRESGGLSRWLLLRISDLWDRIRVRWVAFATAILALVGSLFTLWLWVNSPQRDGVDPATAVQIVAGVSAFLAGSAAAVRWVAPGSKHAAQQLVDNDANPMEKISWLLRRTLRRSRRDVVFLIDDLDRCDPDYIIDFLEIMQTVVRTAPKEDSKTPAFPRSTRTARHRSTSAQVKSALPEPKSAFEPRPPRVFGFIAADGRWLRSAYEARFHNLGAKTPLGRPLGYLFLEKIFQLNVLLPTVGGAGRDRYVSHLLNERSGTEFESDEIGRMDEKPTSEGSRAINGSTISRELRAEVDPDPVKAAAEHALDRARTSKELQVAVRLAQRITGPEEQLQVLSRIAVKYTQPEFARAAENMLTEFAGLIDQNPRNIKLFVNRYGMLQSIRAIDGGIPSDESLALWTILEIRWPELADLLRERPTLVDEWRAAGREIPDLLEDKEVRAVLADERWGRLDAQRIRRCAGLADPAPSPRKATS